MREWLMRLIDWARRDKLERELADELRFHRDRLEQDAVAHGASADDARDPARRRLGNRTRITESARDRWLIPSLDALAQDVRYATRGLLRAPIFSVTIVLTLGLGIGASVSGLLTHPRSPLCDGDDRV